MKAGLSMRISRLRMVVFLFPCSRRARGESSCNMLLVDKEGEKKMLATSHQICRCQFRGALRDR